MLLRLAWATLSRHRSRTLLAVLGVAVSAAMLLDMVMLSSGMRVSFKNLLLARGFQIRLAPKGTLPFDTDATIVRAGEITAALATMPDVAVVSPVLGGQIHVPLADGSVANAVALGGEAAAQGDYEIAEGRAPSAPNELAASDEFLAAAHARIGDTLSAAAGYDPQLRSFAGRRTLTIVGRAKFIYTSTGQRAVAMPLATLQSMQGPGGHDRVSFYMLRIRDDARVDDVLHRIEREIPQVTPVSTETAMRQVDERLSYFRQLALILGAVSLAVGFLLVTTLVTVSVNERLGEIVVLRAIGVARGRIVQQIVLEGTAIMLVGAIIGLGLGLGTARYLNSILSSFPGLPAAIDFFLFQPSDAWTALGMLVGAGILAGIYPSWRGASRPIAITLREEAVG
jgi:putative ABC transport system permease protein